MRILVTGAAGFIGFHLARRLLELGHEVAGLDNFNDYYHPGLKRARDRLLRDHVHYASNELDLCDRHGLKTLLARFEPELVVHMAAQPGVRYSFINPMAYQRSNLEGFMNLIDTVRESGIRKFVYASSSSVYGGITELPYRESQRADRPLSLYAATKLANELITHTYSRNFGMRTVGLRFFTVYGPWGRPDMAPWIFTEKILNGDEIPVYNFGDMNRDFTYIDDIIEGTTLAILSDLTENNELFNIGNHRSEALLDFISVIEKITGKKARTKLLPLQPGDVVSTYADISKLQKAVGFCPKTGIGEGMKRFIDWYLTQPEIAGEIRKRRTDS